MKKRETLFLDFNDYEDIIKFFSIILSMVALSFVAVFVFIKEIDYSHLFLTRKFIGLFGAVVFSLGMLISDILLIRDIFIIINNAIISKLDKRYVLKDDLMMTEHIKYGGNIGNKNIGIDWGKSNENK